MVRGFQVVWRCMRVSDMRALGGSRTCWNAGMLCRIGLIFGGADSNGPATPVDSGGVDDDRLLACATTTTPRGLNSVPRLFSPCHVQ